ncbi:hypothetical protein RF11_07141 [Thelohanellus kitauei]|uniref:Uncharacterized protein n=1 Tax=Thelohanellus kitauei TaxID=669202 RepID=A0A0C2MSQ9_THEKT|nr:hypothetical protein RF11_07141 [Thelohanellus kitauei]
MRTHSDKPETLSQKRPNKAQTQKDTHALAQDTHNFFLDLAHNVGSETQANQLSLKEKKDVIDALKNEQNQSKFARKIRKIYGLRTMRTTVKGILIRRMQSKLEFYLSALSLCRQTTQSLMREF